MNLVPGQSVCCRVARAPSTKTVLRCLAAKRGGFLGWKEQGDISYDIVTY